MIFVTTVYLFVKYATLTITLEKEGRLLLKPRYNETGTYWTIWKGFLKTLKG